MMKFGYIRSDIISETLQSILSTLNIDPVEIEQINNLDILLCFSDDDVLKLPRLKELPNVSILSVEIPGDSSYFAQITFEKLSHVIDQIKNKQFKLDKRDFIKLMFDDTVILALNDIYISSYKVNTRMRYDLYVDDHSLFDNMNSSNAILFSTPTGSTAMAHNLGGAIINPKAQIIQIQTIASRNYLNHHIVSSISEIRLEINDVILPIMIQIDNMRITVETKEFIICKSENSLFFIKLFDQNTPSNEFKLIEKISFEDSKSLTSSAKFILHILKNEDGVLTINELMEITQISNQKTIRASLKLLISKGFIRRKDNLGDLREHLYYYSGFR